MKNMLSVIQQLRGDGKFMTLMLAGLAVVVVPFLVTVWVLSQVMVVPWVVVFNGYVWVWVVVCLVLIERGWG